MNVNHMRGIYTLSAGHREHVLQEAYIPVCSNDPDEHDGSYLLWST